MKNQSFGLSIDRIIAVAALGIALFALLRSGFKSTSAHSDLSALRAELADVRGMLKQLEKQPASAPLAQSPELGAAAGVTVRQVHEWVWGLEQRLVQLEQGVVEGRAATGTSRTPEPDIAQVRQVALNPQASAEDRLAALRALRAADARTPDIVQAMLQLQATTGDPRVRADVFRQLSGAEYPIMKPQLINGVLHDQDPKVREEAAETLAPFWSDPYVQSALTSAAQNDPNEKVRKQALKTPGKKRREMTPDRTSAV